MRSLMNTQTNTQQKNSLIMKLAKPIPGFAIAILIAVVARFIEELLPIHLIGASVIALFLGMFLNTLHKPGPLLTTGLKFTSKRILKFAIILLGASLSIGTILTVGRFSLTVMLFTLFTCFGIGHFVGKALGLNWKLSNLISAGTGICGGSAIAAISPVIDAEDSDIAYAMSATFLFDMAMIVLFPIFGRWLGLTDIAYGLWAGTAVNDTSSVVAAGYAFSENAGDFATMVKLTRTLAILPTVLIFAFINLRLKRKAMHHVENSDSGETTVAKKSNYLSVVPWFILGFVAMAIINSLGYLPTTFSDGSKELSKFLMVAALAAICMNTSFRDMKKAGSKPMLHGFIISLLVVLVALIVEWAIGLI